MSENPLRLGQWIVNILQDKYDLQDINIGDLVVRNSKLSQMLFYMGDFELKSIIDAYYKKDAWKNREKNLNYHSRLNQ